MEAVRTAGIFPPAADHLDASAHRRYTLEQVCC